MSFDAASYLIADAESALLNERTAQGGVYALTVDDIVVYVGQTKKGKISCLAHRIAQHLVCVCGEYIASKPGLNMYDCLKCWRDTGHKLSIKYYTETELRQCEPPIVVPDYCLQAYNNDPIGIAEALLILKYDPVLNIRKPTNFKPNRNRFWDDDFDIKEQLCASDIDWIRDAANVTPKFN